MRLDASEQASTAAHPRFAYPCAMEEHASSDRESLRRLKIFGWFLARLAVAYGLVALIFYVAWPQMGALIAWAGETLVFALSPTPYIEAVAWTEYGFAVTDRLFMKPALVPVPSLPLLVGLPLGFALALPGFSSRPHLVRVVVAAATSVVLAGTTVALVAAQFTRARTAQLGIELYPDWQIAVLNEAVGIDSLWDLGMDLYPFLICVLLTASAYRVSAGASAKETGSWSRWAEPLWVAALVLPLAVVLGSASSARNASRDVLVGALARHNPSLGASLIRLGDHFAAPSTEQTDIESATEWYREAGKERRYADRAALRIRSLSP